MVFGVAFGLGVALTLSRVVAGLAPRLHPGLTAAGIAVCLALGLAMAAWVVHIRTLLGDRAALDRWVGRRRRRCGRCWSRRWPAGWCSPSRC